MYKWISYTEVPVTPGFVQPPPQAPSYPAPVIQSTPTRMAAPRRGQFNEMHKINVIVHTGSETPESFIFYCNQFITKDSMINRIQRALIMQGRSIKLRHIQLPTQSSKLFPQKPPYDAYVPYSVFIKGLDGKSRSVDVYYNDNVKILFTAAAAYEQCPVELLKLEYNGVYLDQDQNMQSCGILKHSTITVTGSINGGGGLDDADDWDFDQAADEQGLTDFEAQAFTEPPEYTDVVMSDSDMVQDGQYVSRNEMLRAIRNQSDAGDIHVAFPEPVLMDSPPNDTPLVPRAGSSNDPVVPRLNVVVRSSAPISDPPPNNIPHPEGGEPDIEPEAEIDVIPDTAKDTMVGIDIIDRLMSPVCITLPGIVGYSVKEYTHEVNPAQHAHDLFHVDTGVLTPVQLHQMRRCSHNVIVFTGAQLPDVDSAFSDLMPQINHKNTKRHMCIGALHDEQPARLLAYIYKNRDDYAKLSVDVPTIKSSEGQIIQGSLYKIKIQSVATMRDETANALKRISQCFTKIRSNLFFELTEQEYSLDYIDSLTEHLSNGQLNTLDADITLQKRDERSKFAAAFKSVLKQLHRRRAERATPSISKPIW